MKSNRINWEKDYDNLDMEAVKESRKARLFTAFSVFLCFTAVIYFIIYKAVHAITLKQYIKYMAIGVFTYFCFVFLLHAILYMTGKNLIQYGKKKGDTENG